MSSSSKIWRYFKVVLDDESRAMCTLCNVKLLRGKTPKTYSTKPLWNHLKSSHKTQHTLINPPKGDDSSDAVGAGGQADNVNGEQVGTGRGEKEKSSQPNIVTAFENMTPLKPNSAQAQAITKAIGGFCFHLFFI